MSDINATQALRSAITALYGGVGEAQLQANQWLNTFSQQPQAWDACLELLDPSGREGAEASFFCANMLLSKVHKEWHKLPQEQQMRLAAVIRRARAARGRCFLLCRRPRRMRVAVRPPEDERGPRTLEGGVPTPPSPAATRAQRQVPRVPRPCGAGQARDAAPGPAPRGGGRAVRAARGAGVCGAVPEHGGGRGRRRRGPGGERPCRRDAGRAPQRATRERSGLGCRGDAHASARPPVAPLPRPRPSAGCRCCPPWPRRPATWTGRRGATSSRRPRRSGSRSCRRPSCWRRAACR
jgi:hypothetical protein